MREGGCGLTPRPIPCLGLAHWLRRSAFSAPPEGSRDTLQVGGTAMSRSSILSSLLTTCIRFRLHTAHKVTGTRLRGPSSPIPSYESLVKRQTVRRRLLHQVKRDRQLRTAAVRAGNALYLRKENITRNEALVLTFQ